MMHELQAFSFTAWQFDCCYVDENHDSGSQVEVDPEAGNSRKL